ncbi:MAG: MBL fold metallo-hydrolase [Thermoguttaceae bacterium]
MTVLSISCLVSIVLALPYTTAPQKFGEKTYATDTINVVGAEQNAPLPAITFFGHASLMLVAGGKTIYIDPVSEYADYAACPKADLILITHEHADHLDTKAIAAVVKKETVIVANDAAAKQIEKVCDIKTLKNGEKFGAEGGIIVEAVPAYNTTEGRDKYHPKHRDNGYVITLGTLRLYIAGDTEDIPEMASLEKIDIAFLPINQPYTMTPAQAVRAAEMVKAKVVYPYHYGETHVGAIQKAFLDAIPSQELRIRDMK